MALLSKHMSILAISFFVTILAYSSSASFQVYGAPPSSGFKGASECYTQAIGPPGTYITDCCWGETDPGDPEQIEMRYCQQCEYDPSTKKHGPCSEVVKEGQVPENDRLPAVDSKDLPALEQGPTTPSQSEGKNTVNMPLTGTIEQSPQANTSPDGQDDDDDENAVFDVKNREILQTDNGLLR